MNTLLTRVCFSYRSFILLIVLAGCGGNVSAPPEKAPPVEALPEANRYAVPLEQIQTLSDEEIDFLMHGSLSTEVLPVKLLKAFAKANPDLFPDPEMENFGLIHDPQTGLPLGVSLKKAVGHLGGQDAVGINCVSCHMTEVDFTDGAEPLRIIGPAGQFDVNAFFGAVVLGMIRPQAVDKGDPVQMKKLLSAWLEASDAEANHEILSKFEKNLAEQSRAIAKTVLEDPWGKKGAGPGGLHDIDPGDLLLTTEDVESDRDLIPVTRALLRLFHNIRMTLHIPELIPPAPETPAGPGRNDAFGLLAYSFFQVKVPVAPAKYGVAWNLKDRDWVHWDGNNNDPIARNLAAALGLGAPIVDTYAILDFAAVQRQTEISQQIRAPRFPLSIDAALAERGKRYFDAECASCHVSPEEDRLFSVKEVGTDPNRSRQIDSNLQGLFQAAVENVAIAGFEPSGDPPFRVTGQYWASDLAGVWARAPYLHNGSVRTMTELLMPADERPVKSRRGTRIYDETQLGYLDTGPFLLDMSLPGNKNTGHEYGTDLSANEKKELIEFLKTL